MSTQTPSVPTKVRLKVTNMYDLAFLCVCLRAGLRLCVSVHVRVYVCLCVFACVFPNSSAVVLTVNDIIGHYHFSITD